MNANHRIQMNYDMLLFFFMSDGWGRYIQGHVCRNCQNLCTLKIPPAEFAKSRLLGAAAEPKFAREHTIYSFGRGTQNCRH